MSDHKVERTKEIGEAVDEVTGETTVETWGLSDSRGNRVETYAYEKNRNYKVEKGTRCAMVVLQASAYGVASFEQRNRAALAAQQEAAMAWASRWGQFQWDLVQMLVTHTTTQVCIEFRVCE